VSELASEPFNTAASGERRRRAQRGARV